MSTRGRIGHWNPVTIFGECVRAGILARRIVEKAEDASENEDADRM